MRMTWLPWTAVGLLAVSLGGTLAWALRTSPAPLPTRFAHVLPAGQTLNGSRGAHIVAVSPDGSLMVYSGAPHGLFKRAMSDLEAKVIPGTEGFEVTEPAFSPDGRSIAFFTIGERAIERININGGAPQLVSRWPRCRPASGGSPAASCSAREREASCGWRRKAAHRKC